MVKLYLDEEWMKAHPIGPGNSYRTESDMKSKHGNMIMHHYKHSRETAVLVEPSKTQNLHTFRDFQSESAHGDVDIVGVLPIPIIVPLNL